MKKITLDPSIAAVVDIENIAHNERVVINFTSDANWVGDFAFKVYNSEKKNSEIVVVNALIVQDNQMTLTLEPAPQNIPDGTKYYEISSVSTKRLLFKGSLKINR
ncbi:hypothetical protein [Flavobacterium laiguense]|uniref:SbsA Ig-like domain-containing protein n=1 Tax=Flavobacterium laiguense TaxID=2169409 RepID=A0A2U1K0G6_9FLAO|nr:hypothetical protein [Flavobacterium laiguense]PWA10987.1 hypothetical protein DB891_03910 [Flavobacterium laiguense]